MVVAKKCGQHSKIRERTGRRRVVPTWWLKLRSDRSTACFGQQAPPCLVVSGERAAS